MARSRLDVTFGKPNEHIQVCLILRPMRVLLEAHGLLGARLTRTGDTSAGFASWQLRLVGGLTRLISDHPMDCKCAQSIYCSNDSLCRRFTRGGVVVERIRIFEERNGIRLRNQRYDWSSRVMVTHNVQRTN